MIQTMMVAAACQSNVSGSKDKPGCGIHKDNQERQRMACQDAKPCKASPHQVDHASLQVAAGLVVRAMIQTSECVAVGNALEFGDTASSA
jgi:hypothetical protein